MSDELDRAQSACAAWQSVFEGIEAHLLDRIAMRDPGDPETYLKIIRRAVSGVNRESEQIVAARWADHARLTARIAELEAERAWRPIAEAPRDGTWLLLKLGVMPNRRWEHMDNMVVVGRNFGDLGGWSIPGVGGLPAAWWQPLPPPPAPEGNADA